jgi:plastocyanin
VPPGAAAILELTAKMPGKFILVDHAMARMAKGVAGVFEVKGTDVARLMYPGVAAAGSPSALAITNEDSHPTNTTAADSARKVAPSPATPDAHPITGGTEPQSGRESPTVPPATSRELNGCLTLDGQMPKLTVFQSRMFFRLQSTPTLLNENPLLFANYNNSLVHVTGRRMDVADTYDPDHAPVFEIEMIDQLAPTCNVTKSLAQLRLARERQSQVTKVGTVSTAQTNHVHMTDMAFVPTNIEVTVGQQVVWQNTSNAIHNVVDDAAQALDKADVALPVSAKPFGSQYLQPGQSYAHLFAQPGVYRYICTLHEGNGMKGVIVVRPGTYVANVHSGSAPSRHAN